MPKIVARPAYALLVMALTALAPSMSRAQGFPGGGGRGRGGFGERGRGPADSVAVRPARPALQVILDAGDKLALTPVQADSIRMLANTLRAENAPRRVAIDSLRDLVKPPSGGYASLSPDEVKELQSNRRQLASLLAASQDADVTAEQHALAVLTESQRKTAQQLIDAERQRANGNGRGIGARMGAHVSEQGSPPPTTEWR